MPLRQGPASSRGLALFLCLCAVLLLMLAGQTAHGQTPSSSAPPSLTALLASCEESLTLLVSRLDERTLQVQSLRESLTASAADLAEAELSLARLQTDLQAMQTSRDALLTQYSALETSWQAYRDEMNKQVSAIQRERNRAKAFAWAFGIGTAAGLTACIIMALK